MKLKSLHVFRELVRSQLARGVVDSRHGFHWPVLGTVDLTGRPQQRTVVLRGMNWNDRAIWCFSDRRSDKVAQLATSGTNSLSWHFFDLRKNLQLRIAGSSQVLSGDDSAEFRRRIPSRKFRDYVGSVAPGTVISHPREADPDQPPTEADMIKNFVVLLTRFEVIDALQIHRDGHCRARFKFSVDNSEGQWIAP